MPEPLLAGGLLVALAYLVLREAVQARRHRELRELLRRIAEKNGLH